MIIDFVKMTKDAIVPTRGSQKSNGFDLYASESVMISAHGGWQLVHTGIAVKMPEDFQNVFGFVTPRSGLALKHGITVLNSPGLIDTDYTGEIGVILLNHSMESYYVHRGDKIAQLVFLEQDAIIGLNQVDSLTETERGAGGFGSTGR